MSERFQNAIPDLRAPIILEPFRTLPGWLADRLLRPGEKVEWVRGPRFNPSWERYGTHPALLLIPLVFGGIGPGLSKLSEPKLMWIVALAAFGLFILTVIILGIASGYFTRLTVTNHRLLILQGHEIVRSWNMDDLPPRLLRYGRWGDHASRTIDLDAVKSMLGGGSDKFTDAKAILSFGKQLDRITKREEDRR